MLEASLAVTGAAAEPGPGGSVPKILLGLAIILILAKLGGELFERIGQPSVLGELLTGIFLGNLHLLGVNIFDFLRQESTFNVLAEVGVVLLLFEVGLETSVKEMMGLGAVATLVAVVGVVVPSVLGLGASVLFHPGDPFTTHLFVGTILCATSVGITARVFKDLGALHLRESKIILGAAVIDDVLGLLILTAVTAVIGAAGVGRSVDMLGLAGITAKALAFLIISVVAGLWLSPRLFRLATRLRSRGLLMTLGLAFCFFLSYLADGVGLAPIVGAFTAGLILEDVHYRDLARKENTDLRHLLEPITALLLPIFFVLMGMRVDVLAFASLSGVAFAAVITAAAILGKQACSLVPAGPDVDRTLVGLGMIPRGEVGLIFAGIGATLALGGKPVVSQQVFSAAVIMVMLTTLVTPPLLKWRLQRISSRRKPAAEETRVM